MNTIKDATVTFFNEGDCCVVYRRQVFINTDAGKWNALASKLILPVGHHLCSELLVERAGVRQEASGQQNVAYQPAGLRLEAPARLRPTHALAGQTVDQSRSVVHLATTCVRVVHQRLQRIVSVVIRQLGLRAEFYSTGVQTYSNHCLVITKNFLIKVTQ